MTTTKRILVGLSLFASTLAFAQAGSIGDLTNAKKIEVRDTAGQLVLEGAFDHRAERDGDIDKDAPLNGASARGEADIDISGGEQELEIEARGLAVDQPFSVWIDGKKVATFASDRDGRADAQWVGAKAR